MLKVDIPGFGAMELRYAVLDLNGTLTYRGSLIDGVAERIDVLRSHLDVHILSSDTFGTREGCAFLLQVQYSKVATCQDKVRFLEHLGPSECVAIGNGANGTGMLRLAGLGICVVGPEGAASAAIVAADIVCHSIVEALDVVVDGQLLTATLKNWKPRLGISFRGPRLH